MVTFCFSDKLATRRKAWSQLWQCQLADKLAAKHFAEQLGVPVPTLYWHGPDVSELPAPGLPSTFVLKPLRSHSAKGVVLARRGINNLTGGPTNWTEIRHDRIYEQGALLEEYIPTLTGQYDCIESYKVFVFGEVCIIRVNNEAFVRDKGSIKCVWESYYTEDWTPIEQRISNYAETGPELPAPKYLDELLAYAKRLGEAYGTFVRVDFFLSPKGPRFGEFCSNPYAGKYFTEYGEEFFGRLWEQNLGDAI